MSQKSERRHLVIIRQIGCDTQLSSLEKTKPCSWFHFCCSCNARVNNVRSCLGGVTASFVGNQYFGECFALGNIKRRSYIFDIVNAVNRCINVRCQTLVASDGIQSNLRQVICLHKPNSNVFWTT